MASQNADHGEERFPDGNWLAGMPVGERVSGDKKRKEVRRKILEEKRETDLRYLRFLKRSPKAEIFLYNIDTEKGYTIKTDGVESEVLLIENDVVYYRVKDRLYRSEIRNGRMEPELLSQDPELLNVYCAFQGPSCEEVE